MEGKRKGRSFGETKRDDRESVERADEAQLIDQAWDRPVNNAMHRRPPSGRAEVPLFWPPPGLTFACGAVEASGSKAENSKTKNISYYYFCRPSTAPSSPPLSPLSPFSSGHPYLTKRPVMRSFLRPVFRPASSMGRPQSLLQRQPPFLPATFRPLNATPTTNALRTFTSSPPLQKRKGKGGAAPDKRISASTLLETLPFSNEKS